MNAAFASLLGLWGELRAGHHPLPTVTAIPPEHCTPGAAAGSPISGSCGIGVAVPGSRSLLSTTQTPFVPSQAARQCCPIRAAAKGG